jgi:hypothetical protein
VFILLPEKWVLMILIHAAWLLLFSLLIFKREVRYSDGKSNSSIPVHSSSEWFELYVLRMEDVLQLLLISSAYNFSQ